MKRNNRVFVRSALVTMLLASHAWGDEHPQPAIDGSTTITTGGTAQSLFSGAIPSHGWTVINPDVSEDCWVSDTTTAAANNTGSIRLAANGGGYESTPGRKPIAAVSVVCATTGHKLTASYW